MKNSKAPAFLLKLVISLGLVSFFLWHIDLLQIHEALTKTKFGYLLIGLLLYPLGQVICAVKWQYLARALGIHRDLKPMVGLYFIGMFFNLFLPTGVGGDITRGLYLNPEGK
ncbi:MAG TPA: lysylphosphatidylglycerol synthase domain-containing protein, partial [Acidobacteriota bacterium]|nr:lysylphosphatidylglycerol synthase domain-containing protein [Acidobacteriota bacterium]